MVCSTKVEKTISDRPTAAYPPKNYLAISNVSMETLEFVIYPDGRVQEKVTGIIGRSCAEVTAAIEAQLGQVVSLEQTSEYFGQKVDLSATVTAQTTCREW